MFHKFDHVIKYESRPFELSQDKKVDLLNCKSIAFFNNLVKFDIGEEFIDLFIFTSI